MLLRLEPLNCNIISLVHEMGNYYEKGAWKTVAERSDKVVFPCHYIKNLALENSVFEEAKIRVYGQGLYNSSILNGDKKAARRRLRSELHIEPNALIALGCGSTIARKGIDIFCFTAISVLANIRQSGRPVYFVWVGDGDPNSMEEWVRRDIDQSNYSDKILFIGARKKTAPYFLGSDLFFMTSRGDPYPSVVMEAMAAGLPIVGFENSGGYPEMLYHPSAYLHPYGDIRAASVSIEELIRRPELLVQYEQESMQHVRENHTQKKYAKHIYSLFRAVEEPNTVNAL